MIVPIFATIAYIASHVSSSSLLCMDVALITSCFAFPGHAVILDRTKGLVNPEEAPFYRRSPRNCLKLWLLASLGGRCRFVLMYLVLAALVEC